MKTPLQAKPVPRARGRRVTGQGESHRRTAEPPEADAKPNRRAASASTWRQAGLIREVQGTKSRAPGMRKAGREASPAGDEREGANLEQPDSGEAAGAPKDDDPVAICLIEDPSTRMQGPAGQQCRAESAIYRRHTRQARDRLRRNPTPARAARTRSPIS